MVTLIIPDYNIQEKCSESKLYVEEAIGIPKFQGVEYDDKHYIFNSDDLLSADESPPQEMYRIIRHSPNRTEAVPVVDSELIKLALKEMKSKI